MDPISQLIVELSIDPFRLEDFMRDPDPMLAAEGIPLEDVPLLWAPDEAATDETWARCAFCVDPGLDPLPDPDVPVPLEPEPSSDEH